MARAALRGDAAARPPLLPRLWRLARWFFGSGIVCLIWRRRRYRRLRREEYALSPPRRSGRVRGRPPPRRATRTRSMMGMNCGASPHWPGVISRASGRRPPSPTRWILQVRPPRERPSPSSERCCRALIFSRHPRASLAGAGSVLVSPAGGGVHAHHRPVDTALRVGVSQDSGEEPVPRAVRRPASVSLIHGLPLAETRRQIPPGHPRAIPVQDPVDDPPMAHPTTAPLSGLR